MSNFHAVLHTWLQQAWEQAHSTPLPLRGWGLCPRPELADLTHSGALLGAKALQKNPKILAQAWKEQLPEHPWVASAELVGPGYLNVQLSVLGWEALLHDPQGSFEQPNIPGPTLVEFVSANPTGPLHLGHARQAVLGDVLAKLLKKLGGKVGTEFFYNDAGEQIQWLVTSVELRVQEQQGAILKFERDGATLAELLPGEILFPANAYHGDYIQDIAKAWLQNPDQDIKSFAIDCISKNQQKDLDYLGVYFDQKVSEKSLYDSGEVKHVVQHLLKHAYQATHDQQSQAAGHDQALPAWFLKTTKMGDDKDRVMIKSNGSYTYFVPDVAYHINKWNRGWKHAINIQGSDHHGTLARVQAGVQFVKPEILEPYPEVMFHTMIKVMKNGQAVKASKRAGDYLTAREIADQLGIGAFRLFMLDKKADTPMTLDIDQWIAQSSQNPIYNIEYAYARIKKTLEKMQAQPPGNMVLADLQPLEKQLLLKVAIWEDRMLQAALDHEPTRVSLFTRELAGAIHEVYQKGPKLLKLDTPSQNIRKALYDQVIQTLVKASELLGFNYQPLAFLKKEEIFLEKTQTPKP